MMQVVAKQADVWTDFKIEAAEVRASAPLLIVVSFWVARFARVFQHVWEEEETAGDLRTV